MEKAFCTHLINLGEPMRPRAYQCEECVKTGSRWAYLRTCQTCGVTLCCDSSINRHATRHFEESGHPVVISAEPGDKWAWCYVDENIMRLS